MKKSYPDAKRDYAGLSPMLKEVLAVIYGWGSIWHTCVSGSWRTTASCIKDFLICEDRAGYFGSGYFLWPAAERAVAAAQGGAAMR